MSYPDDLAYTSEHEWVRRTDGTAVRVGITDYAQDALGDIVYVTLPDVGATLTRGEPCGELESTKSVSDIFAPISGTVSARNEALESGPEAVNSEPYDSGWLFEVEPSEPAELDDLLDAPAYQESLGGA